jgi:hypothetical protein
MHESGVVGWLVVVYEQMWRLLYATRTAGCSTPAGDSAGDPRHTLGGRVVPCFDLGWVTLLLHLTSAQGDLY